MSALVIANGCVIINTDIDEITNDAVVISWETDEPSDSVVLFAEYPTGNEEYIIDDALVTSHKVKITGLKRNTIYFYIAISCNDEICFISETYNFTTADINKESNALRVDSLRILDEYVKPGEDIEANVRIQNSRNSDLNDVRVTVILPELGLRKRIGPFDVDDDKEVNKQIRLTLPEDVKPGEYVVKIIISGNNGEIRRVKHRYITVY